MNQCELVLILSSLVVLTIAWSMELRFRTREEKCLQAWERYWEMKIEEGRKKEDGRERQT